MPFPTKVAVKLLRVTIAIITNGAKRAHPSIDISRDSSSNHPRSRACFSHSHLHHLFSQWRAINLEVRRMRLYQCRWLYQPTAPIPDKKSPGSKGLSNVS